MTSFKSTEKIPDVVCRACLRTKQKFKYYIHENVPHQTYTFCTSVEVSPVDHLTRALCNQCFKLLTKFSTFKQITIESNKKLLSVIPIMSTNNASETDAQCGESANKNNDVRVKIESDIRINTSDDFDTEDCDYFLSVSKEESDGEQNKIDDAKTEKRPKKDKILSNSATKPKRITFKCDICCTQFVDPDRYEAHLQWHQGNIVPIQCKTCNKPFNTWSGLQRHKEASHKAVRLSTLACNICGKISKSKQALRSHLNYHKAKMVVCYVCGKEMRQSDMRFHMSTHGDARTRFECSQCGNTYLSRGTLDKHVRRRHEGRRYICDTCGASFSDKHALIPHFLRHAGQKPHRCELCGAAFLASGELRNHTRLHTGERPFACDYCPKRFVARKRLVEHIRTHTAEKPHKCHVCPQAFAQRGTLKRHLKVHQKNGLIEDGSASILVAQ